MIIVHIDTNQADVILERIQKGLSNLNPLWEMILVQALFPTFNTVFDTGGFGRWEPREDSEPNRLLQDTGELRNSLTQRNASGQIDERTPTTFTFGTDVEHAATHEYGRGAIPARPFISILEDNAVFNRLVERVATDYINKLSQV